MIFLILIFLQLIIVEIIIHITSLAPSNRPAIMQMHLRPDDRRIHFLYRHVLQSFPNRHLLQDKGSPKGIDYSKLREGAILLSKLLRQTECRVKKAFSCKFGYLSFLFEFSFWKCYSPLNYYNIQFKSIIGFGNQLLIHLKLFIKH